MYKLVVSTHQGYRVATFLAGNTMLEANAFYKSFMRDNLYPGHIISITQ